MELILHFRPAGHEYAPDLPTPSSNKGPLSFLVSLMVNREDLFDEGRADPGTLMSVEHDLFRRNPESTDGSRLWTCLPEQVRAAIKLRADGEIWLKIASGMPSVDNLPWELAGQAAAMELGRPVRVSRFVPVRLPPAPALTATLPVRILIVVTNPKDEQLLDSNREVYALRAGIDSNQYEVQVLQEATADSAAAVMQFFQPHVLHYVGHSGANRGSGYLVLHDPNRGTTEWVGADDIAKALPVSVRVGCLSTCFTQQNYDVTGLALFAHAPATVRLPTMVINRFGIDEKAVQTFWRVFYEQMITAGGNVAAALVAGQQATAAAEPNSLNWASFSLVARDGGDQPLHIGQQRDAGQFASEVQAQFASRLAADLADKLRAFSPSSQSESLTRSLSEAQQRVREYTKRISKSVTE